MGNFAPPQAVDGLPRVPLPYGLFSAVTFREPGDPGWENGVEWESLTCDPASGIGDPLCEPTEGGGTDATGLPKGFIGSLTSEASAFAVYGSFVCSPIGWTPEAAQDRATLHLLAREEARVEQALATGDLDNTPNLQDSADTLAAGAQVDAVRAVAELEQFLATHYGSLGVIHMTRAAATAAAALGAVRVVGSGLVTALGTPVVAGAGYPGSSPAGAAPGAGESWAYASPPLLGYRSTVFTSSNRSGDLLDRGQNNLHAVAERKYLIGYDQCDPDDEVTGAVLVSHDYPA